MAPGKGWRDAMARWRRLAPITAGFAVVLLPAMPVPAQDAALFKRLSGGWGGTGSVRLPTGGVERIRCRGAYSGGGPRLHVDLACASDSFKVRIVAEMTREGERVTGSWSEAGSGVGGGLSGTARGDGIAAGFSGPGVSGSLSMALRGNVQTVTLVSQNQIAGSATVTLHRT